MRRLHEFARAESRIAIARSRVLFPRGHHVGQALAFYADTVQGLLTREEAGTTGSVTVQGVAYETVDLADRLALSSDKDGRDSRLVLFAHGGLQGSVRVPQVHGLIELEQSLVLGHNLV